VKDIAVGVTATCTIPVPVSAICCGLLPASSVIIKLADLAPSAPGVKVTLTVQKLFTGTVLPQVVVISAKSLVLLPAIPIEAMLIVPALLLVKVTALTRLVVPMD
jgi:hypothetical protein